MTLLLREALPLCAREGQRSQNQRRAVWKASVAVERCRAADGRYCGDGGGKQEIQGHYEGTKLPGGVILNVLEHREMQ